MAASYSTTRFFMAHLKDFEDYLNVDEVIPLLCKQLLTLDEMETLDSLSTRRKKITCLVKIMCIKGDRAPSLFIACVRNAKEHFPHPELADKMEKWLRDTPPICSEKTQKSHQNQSLARNDSQPREPSNNAPQSVGTTPVAYDSSHERQQDRTNLQDISTVDTISNHTLSEIMAEQSPQVASSLPQMINVPSGLGANTTVTTSSRQQDNTNPNTLQDSTFESQFQRDILSVTMAEQPPRLVQQAQVTSEEQTTSSSPPQVINVPVSSRQQNNTNPNTLQDSTFESQFQRDILSVTMAEQPPRLVQQAQVTSEEQTASSSPPQVINVPHGLGENTTEAVSSPQQNNTNQTNSIESNFESRFDQHILFGTMAEEAPRLVQQAQVLIQEQTSNSLLYQNSPSSFADDLPSPLDQVAPDYVHLVRRISSHMARNCVLIESVVAELNRIMHDAHMGITIQQEEVRDFASLCLHIRQLGLCHESDIDLLCRLIYVLGLQELHSLALEYADHIMSNRALTCRHNSTSTQTHHLLLTFHSNPDMTLGEAFEIKDMISGILSIHRHTFSLASTRPGSIVLVWKIATAFLKHTLSVFGVDEIKTRLDSDPTLSSIKLEYTEGSQVHIEEVYSKRRMICDRSISSSTEQMDEEERPSSSVGVKRGAQSDVTMPTDLQPPPLHRARPDRSHDKQTGSRTDPLPIQPGSTSQLPSSLQFRQPPHEFSRQYIPPSHDVQSHYSSSARFNKIYMVRSSSTHSEDHLMDESPLQVLIKTLRTSYADDKFFKKSAGLNKRKIRFINLALVKKKGISAEDAENDEFLQSTLHGSVDDIIKKKEDIDLQAILNYGKEGSRKLVLVEGAPGVGKTMLALKICQLWADNKLLDEYDMVLLVTLRRFQQKPFVVLSDLLIHLQGSLRDQATEELLRSEGDRTLLILEGWDELPPKLREEGSFFFDIVEGNMLPKASVLVTSRPTVTSDLYEYMDERHIEVLGFNTDQITQYVQLHGGDMSQTILSHLNKFPNLKALAHIPLTLSIICHVARKDSALPHTLTKLYRQHICNTLFLTLKRHVTFKSLSGVSCLEELPVEVRSVINSLCTLALDGFKEKKFVYSKEDLLKVGLEPNAFDGYGLLNAPVMAVEAGFEQIYQFNHLSIQEFLAAYGIQHLLNDQRVFLLREFRKDKQFQNIWKFFSGITRLENEYFKELIISETGKANRDQLFLLHCLYEADNPAISQKAAEKMFYVLNLGNMLLNTTDCLCAAHMITSAGGEWQVELRGCNMGEDGLRIFKTSLLTHIEAHGVLGFTITRLDLTQNRIRTGSVGHLADMINSKMQLHSLILSSNPFGDEGMRTLTAALKQPHTTTKSLHFSSCELTKDGAFELADVLRANSTITELYISFEPFGCHGVERIAQALDNRYNKTLTELSLTKTDMTSAGLTALAQMAPVNQTLTVLRLDRNSLVADDCHLVATIIEKSSSLILIDLSKNPIGDAGFERVLESLIAKPKGSLKRLGVFGCDVTPKGLKKLVELFSVTETFVGIQLGCNKLGDEGAELVGEALKRNSSKSVKHVLMEATKVTDEGKKKLQEICDSINSERDTENKLDLNYRHHSQVVQKRNSTNYL